MKRGDYWTAEEIALIRRMAGQATAAEISRALLQSLGSVRTVRATEQAACRRANVSLILQGCRTIDVAHLFGVSADVVHRWVAAGLLCPSAPPAPVVSNSRVACIEAKESGGANVANRRGSGAVGVLQYMPSTFAAHAREMGHPEYSPWVPWQTREVAAHDLALGRRSQWTVSGC